jgi:predicted Co/Zn/Cd cation transporter (cation efflux family)
LTDRELLSCHAAVKALQSQLGTSYKDASHQLYLAEVEKLEQQDITLKTYTNLKERMEDKLESFENRFKAIMARMPYDKHMAADADFQECGVRLSARSNGD